MEYAQMIYKPLIIAEACCNHQGSMDIAHEMIKTAAIYCKCDYIKFQKRDIEKYNIPEFNIPHPNSKNSFGETYYLHRKFLEFDLNQHNQLKIWCEESGIKYACSVWDTKSAQEIISLNPDYIKVPSAQNLDFELLRYLCSNYDRDIHVSLGMTTEEELYKILELFKNHNRHHSLVLYACTSSYPCRFDDICLYEINKLHNYCNKVGFSGHHLGFSVDIAAMMLGISYIERHYTLDRSNRGSDHASSLEPDQIRRLSRDRDNVWKTLTYKQNKILDCELPSYKKLKRKVSLSG